MMYIDVHIGRMHTEGGILCFPTPCFSRKIFFIKTAICKLHTKKNELIGYQLSDSVFSLPSPCMHL